MMNVAAPSSTNRASVSPRKTGASPMRCPVRRPSMDLSVRSSALETSSPNVDQKEPPEYKGYPVKSKKNRKAVHCVFFDDDDDDDDATQVTSNNSHREDKTGDKPCSDSTHHTATTAKSTVTPGSPRILSPIPNKKPTRSPSPNVDDDLRSKPGEINVWNNGPPGDLLEGDDAPSSSHHRLTPARIRSFLTDYYEDFASIFHNRASSVAAKKAGLEALMSQYYTEDVLWIRSSGNPIGGSALTDMLCEDIAISSAVLVSIDRIQILARGAVATVVHTSDLMFRYKGQPQRDRTVLTVVVQLDEPSQAVRMAHVHWSVGTPIPPDEETSGRWETTR